MVSFKSLEVVDFPLLFEWLQRLHVKEWWDDGDDTLEKVVEHYGPSSDKEEVERFILMWSPAADTAMRPVGYFQWYLLPDGTAGTDQFIGEPDLLEQGIGTEAVPMFLAMLIERYDPPRIVVDPDPRNARAIRCYEKVGFRHYVTLTNEDGTSAYIMEIRR